MLNSAAILSPSELFSGIKSALCLATLAGDRRPMAAYTLARDLWEQFPAMFPDFAALLRDEPLSPRGACWSLAAELANVPGSWDLYTRARDIAAE